MHIKEMIMIFVLVAMLASLGYIAYRRIALQLKKKNTDFDELFARLCSETGFHSFDHQIMAQPSFQELVGIGQEAIKPILERIQSNNDDVALFLALERITGIQPINMRTAVEIVDGGFTKTDIAKCSEVWLQWGKENNYI